MLFLIVNLFFFHYISAFSPLPHSLLSLVTVLIFFVFYYPLPYIPAFCIISYHYFLHYIIFIFCHLPIFCFLLSSCFSSCHAFTSLFSSLPFILLLSYFYFSLSSLSISPRCICFNHIFLVCHHWFPLLPICCDSFLLPSSSPFSFPFIFHLPFSCLCIFLITILFFFSFSSL